MKLFLDWSYEQEYPKLRNLLQFFNYVMVAYYVIT